MARQPRIHIKGGYYHVMIRGNGGDKIFHTDEARLRFYLLMQEGIERFGHRVHAFCLMDNHVHLIIQVGKVSLSRIMQNLSFRYTLWFNGQKKRVGHLFQGRFKALLLDEESYLLELVRYTHLNPVRADMVKEPSDYLWSSHLAYMGHETLPWLTCDVVLSHFSSEAAEARSRYANFVFDGMSEQHRPEFHCGSVDSRVLGDDTFAEKSLAGDAAITQKVSLDQCIEVVSKYYELAPVSLSERNRVRKPAEARAVVAWLIRECGDESLTFIANFFNRDVATMSTAVRKLEKRAAEDDIFRNVLATLKHNINV
jgi:REP element-mobilizing transposase RayT